MVLGTWVLVRHRLLVQAQLPCLIQESTVSMDPLELQLHMDWFQTCHSLYQLETHTWWSDKYCEHLDQKKNIWINLLSSHLGWTEWTHVQDAWDSWVFSWTLWHKVRCSNLKRFLYNYTWFVSVFTPALIYPLPFCFLPTVWLSCQTCLIMRMCCWSSLWVCHNSNRSPVIKKSWSPI